MIKMDGNILMISMDHGKIKEECLILLEDASGLDMRKRTRQKNKKLMWEIKSRKINEIIN